MTDQPTDSEPAIRMYPALRVMEQQAKPLKNGREPYWRAPVTPATADHYTPVWNWHSPRGQHDFPAGAKEVVFDANAAYLAAIGSADIAHSNLVQRGLRPEDKAEVMPGYYRIEVPYWAFSGTIVHPLGDSSRVQTEGHLWVAAPTLTLLLELLDTGHIGGLSITDSYTANVKTTFRSWSDRLRTVRTECMDRIDLAHTDTARRAAHVRYDAFKTGYSAALSMMLTGEKCLTRRPDWTHTVHAQHSAAMWRRAWRWTFTGFPLVSMGRTDEIAVLQDNADEVFARPTPPPFKLDNTGRSLGSVKIKSVGPVGGPVQEASSVPLVDEQDEDIV